MTITIPFIRLVHPLPNSSFTKTVIDFDHDLIQKNSPICSKHYRLRKHCGNLAQLIHFLHCFRQSQQYRSLVRQRLGSFVHDSNLNPVSISVGIEFVVQDWNLASISSIDIKWCVRIQYLATLRMDLEESLSWLSTLGGAYSSLGDKNIHFAKQAEKISISQMQLSSIYGDPNLTARCMIYLSHSWSQQGKRRKAIKLIKYSLYPFLRHLGPNCDLIVKRMYQALCFRVRYIYKYYDFNKAEESNQKKINAISLLRILLFKN